ncbi:uncharacterized protein LOC144875413 [Branchiostoma floridae x Branchiostoma japonicum]
MFAAANPTSNHAAFVRSEADDVGAVVGRSGACRAPGRKCDVGLTDADLPSSPGLPDAPPLSTDQLIAKWQAENSTERDEGYHSYHGPTSSTGRQGLPADGEKPTVTKNSARWRSENERRKHNKKLAVGEKLRQPRWDRHLRQPGRDTHVGQSGWDHPHLRPLGWDTDVRQSSWDSHVVQQHGLDPHVRQPGWDSHVRQPIWNSHAEQPSWDSHVVRQLGWDSDSDFDQDSPELDEPPFTVFDREAELLIHNATKRRPANVQAVVINTFASGDPGQLNVARGDVVRVLYRTEDWVRVANVWRDRGFIPYSYVWPLGRRFPRKAERQRSHTSPPHAINPGGRGWTCHREEIEQDPVAVVSDSPDLSGDSQSDDAGDGFFARLLHGPALTVLFDFRAIDEGDVTVSRGETVMLLNEDDADWVWVRNRAGREGFIPRRYAVQTCEACRTVLKKNLQKLHSHAWEREATRGNWEQAKTGPHHKNPPQPSTPCRQLIADDFFPTQDRKSVFDEKNTMSFSQKVASDPTTWQGGNREDPVQRPQGWRKVPHKQQRTVFTTDGMAERSACTCAARVDKEGTRWQKERKEDKEEWPQGCQTSSEELKDFRGNSQGVIRDCHRRKMILSENRKCFGLGNMEHVPGLPIRNHTGAAQEQKGVCFLEQESAKTSLKEQAERADYKKSPWWNLETSQDCSMILRDKLARGQNWEQEQGQSWEQEQGQTWEQEHGQSWEREQGQTWERDQGQTWEQEHGQSWEQEQGQSWEREQGQSWEQEQSQSWEQEQGQTWEREQGQSWKREQGQSWEQEQSQTWEQEWDQTWEQEWDQTWEETRATSRERRKLLNEERDSKVTRQNYRTQLRKQAMDNMRKQRNSGWDVPTGHSAMGRGGVYISKLETAL